MKNKIINENHKNDYGCVMITVNFPEITKIHQIITEDDIYVDPNDDSYGLEKEPHVTLLYGLHDGINGEEIKRIIGEILFGRFRLYNPSIFKSKGYDVLKYDVMGDGLIEGYEQLKRFPYTNEFPDYHPHLTVGYLREGRAQRYADALKGSEFVLSPKKGIFSKSDGSKEYFNVLVKG